MKKLYAQELVEFLLIAPFLIILFGIITEFAYAMHINLSLTNALKRATASLYSQVSPDMTREKIKSELTKTVTQELSDANAPIEGENNISVDYIIAGNSAVVFADYTYHSAFTLPDKYFSFLPSQFDFRTSQIVPAALFRSGAHPNATIPVVSPAGIATTQSSSETSQIVFFVPLDIEYGTTYFKMVDWNGRDLLDGGYIDNYFNLRTDCDMDSNFHWMRCSWGGAYSIRAYKTVYVLNAYLPIGSDLIKDAMWTSVYKRHGMRDIALAMVDENDTNGDIYFNSCGNFDGISTNCSGWYSIKTRYTDSSVIVYPQRFEGFVNSIRMN